MQQFSEERYETAQNRLNSIASRNGADGSAWDYFVAVLISDGYLNANRMEEAGKIVAAKDAADAEKRRKVEAAYAARQAALDCPDQAYPRIFSRSGGDPTELNNWFKKTPVEALENLLNQLQGNPYHWRSLYPRGKFTEAVSLLESEVSKRKNK